MDRKKIESVIGYTFRNPELLKVALTHSSYANEHGGESNERMEYLGDAVIQLFVSERLYGMGGDEGVMTQRRQKLVSAEPLEEAVKRLGLDRFLIHAGGKENVGKKAISSLFESVTAAIYLDGGAKEARRFVISNLFFEESGERNYKGELQELLQSHGSRPSYTLLSKSGEDHAPVFSVKAEADGKIAEGKGKSRKTAEQNAAKAMLSLMKGRA